MNLQRFAGKRRGLIEVRSQYLCSGTEKRTHENTFIRTVGVPAEIRTYKLQTTSLKVYLQINLFSKVHHNVFKQRIMEIKK